MAKSKLPSFNSSLYEISFYEDEYILPSFDDIREVEMKIITGKLFPEQQNRAIIKIKLARLENNQIVYETPILRGLIDTGATVMNIRGDIFKALNPISTEQPFIQKDMNTGSKIHTTIHSAYYYLPDFEDNLWQNIQLIANDNLPSYTDLVVGTNFLTPFKFTYNGSEKYFELELTTRFENMRVKNG